MYVPSVFRKDPRQLINKGTLKPNTGGMLEAQNDKEAGAREQLHQKTWVQANAVTSEPATQL